MNLINVKAHLFFLLISIIFTGCSPKNNDEVTLPGTWRLYDAEHLETNSKDADPLLRNEDLKELVKDGDLLSLFEDGSFTDIKGDGFFKSGKWVFSQKNSILQLIDQGKTGMTVKLKTERTASGKQMLIFTSMRQDVVFKFIKESEPLKEFKNDPFYPDNNQWRIKSKQKEDSAMLVNRLANYFRHLAFILKSAKERKQQVVSFEFSRGPAKIYNGGIGIYPFNIVPDSWKDTFFDHDDAFVAHLRFEDYLRTNHYRGAGIGDWIVDDYNILVSIYSGISQQKNTK